MTAATPIMDFNGSGSLEMRYLNGPTGDIVDTVLARRRRRHDRLVSARPAGDDPRPDQQLGIDHRSRRLQRLRHRARRVEPVERRSDDGLRGDGAGYGHGAELGGGSGAESGDGEVDESGSGWFYSGRSRSLSLRAECTNDRERSRWFGRQHNVPFSDPDRRPANSRTGLEYSVHAENYGQAAETTHEPEKRTRKVDLVQSWHRTGSSDGSGRYEH